MLKTCYRLIILLFLQNTYSLPSTYLDPSSTCTLSLPTLPSKIRALPLFLWFAAGASLISSAWYGNTSDPLKTQKHHSMNSPVLSWPVTVWQKLFPACKNEQVGCSIWFWGWWAFYGFWGFYVKFIFMGFYLKFTLVDSNLEELATSLEHLLHFSELANIS